MGINQINAVALKELLQFDNVTGVTFYGLYSGRGGFEGVGVEYDGSAALMQLGIALGGSKRFEHLADGFHHMDNMGTNKIGAWYSRYFTAESLEDIK